MVRVVRAGGDDLMLTADVVLIATGSSPRWPEMFPRHPRVYDSDTILTLTGMPPRLLIVGGGVIGCEYACIFGALDLKVTLVHAHDSILPFIDEDLAAELQASMLRLGITMCLSAEVIACQPADDCVSLTLADGRVLAAEAVMIAMGRTSNTAALDLAAGGITPGRHGRLAVDETYGVIHPESGAAVPGIYAAGDVIGPPGLAATSMEQARLAMIKAFALDPYKEQVAPIMPVGIYTIPECSGVGMTEADCRRAGLDYVVGRADYRDNARGQIIGDCNGFLKLIYACEAEVGKPMRLLGAHVIGEIATELAHLGLCALTAEATSSFFINTCFNYPTLGELYKYATYDAMGRRARRAR